MKWRLFKRRDGTEIGIRWIPETADDCFSEAEEFTHELIEELEELRQFKKEKLSEVRKIANNEILGITRKWIQWNCINGSKFTWGSRKRITDMTVDKMEHLAGYITSELNKKIQLYQHNRGEHG